MIVSNSWSHHGITEDTHHSGDDENRTRTDRSTICNATTTPRHRSLAFLPRLVDTQSQRPDHQMFSQYGTVGIEPTSACFEQAALPYYAIRQSISAKLRQQESNLRRLAPHSVNSRATLPTVNPPEYRECGLRCGVPTSEHQSHSSTADYFRVPPGQKSPTGSE